MDAVTELEQIISRHQAITAEFAGKEIPAEKRAEQQQLAERGKTLHAAIEAKKAAEAEAADVESMRSFLERPVAKVPMGSPTADDDGRKVLSQQGWESKSGVLYAPTSRGLVAMFPEHVLFGKLPDDPKSAAYCKAMRASFTPDYTAAFESYIRKSIRARSDAGAILQLSGREQAALSEGQDDKGGYLVPAQRVGELLSRREARSIMRKYVRTVPTSSDKIQWPRVQAHGTDGSVYSSAFVGDWAGETPAFTETDPKFGLFDIPIKKVRTATKQSNDLLSDAAFDILAFLATDGAKNIALVEDKGFITGDGTALQPRGIMNSGADETDVSGTTADTISNTVADRGSADKLIDFVYKVPDQYLQDAVFLTRRANEGKIRKLLDGDGRYLWPDTGFGATPKDLLGYPKETSPFVAADGTDANKVGLFGSLGDAYIIAERTAISVVVLRERFADTDQTGIVLFSRVGGDTHNTDAIRIAKV